MPRGGLARRKINVVPALDHDIPEWHILRVARRWSPAREGPEMSWNLAYHLACQLSRSENAPWMVGVLGSDHYTIAPESARRAGATSPRIKWVIVVYPWEA